MSELASCETRVRAFIDFAVSYMTKEFGSNT